MSILKKTFLILTISIFFAGCTSSDFQKVLDTIGDVAGDAPLTEGEVANGLKQALEIGLSKGVNVVSLKDGFFKNTQIKIPWPSEVKKVENTLRNLGMNKLADNVILSLNRAAEDASKQAKPIFVNAIKQMTFQDAMGILRGGDNAATDYLIRTTSNQLRGKFKPVISNSLKKVDATKYWGDVAKIYNKLPTTQNKMTTDLSDYATQKTMDGLFVMVAKEEKKIRKDPVARTTELLKRVFGSLDKN